MKRTASAICAAMLSVALAACGGAQDTSTGAKQDSAQTATEQVATDEKDGKDEKVATENKDGKDEKVVEEADPAEKFLGEWKPAAITMGGQIVVGNIDTYLLSKSEDTKGYLQVSEDGTAVHHLSGNPSDTLTKFTWELVGDDELKLVQEPAEDADDAADAEDAADWVVALTYQDGELVFDPQDEDDISTQRYSRDGTTDAYETYDLTKATKVTDAKGLVGTWKLVVISKEGTMIFGDLSAFGDSFAPCEFREDGTAMVGGIDDLDWEVGEKGVILSTSDITFPMTVKALDDKLVVDESVLAGLASGSMQLVYAK